MSPRWRLFSKTYFLPHLTQIIYIAIENSPPNSSSAQEPYLKLEEVLVYGYFFPIFNMKQ